MARKLTPARKDRAAAIGRLRSVARAVNTGKSNRQIARELHCDERTVRFDRQKLAKLTPAELESVLHGEAPHALLKKANTTPTSSAPGTPNPRTVRAIVDLIFRCLAEEWTVVTDAVLPFRGRQCTEHNLRLVPADQERVLKDVDTSWNPLRFGSRPCGKRIDIVERCRPAWTPDPPRRYSRANQLARGVVARLAAPHRSRSGHPRCRFAPGPRRSRS